MSTDINFEQSKDTSYGRVVRLHFACRAKLPIGSSLRVTSSQLWAPASLTPNDPIAARHVSSATANVALPNNTTQGGDVIDPTGAVAGASNVDYANLYASSVEMVTSPETYPLWKTRTPVVLSLRHHHGFIQQHRYRYMVVTPGALTSDSNKMLENEDDDEEDEYNVKVTGMKGTGSITSQGDFVATEVVAWENPFYDNELPYTSTASLPSVRKQAYTKTLANLPYRTIDIDTITGKPKPGDHAPSNHTEYTTDGIPIDNWDDKDDESFFAYLLRSEVNRQNKAKKQLMNSRRNSYMTNENDNMSGPMDLSLSQLTIEDDISNHAVAHGLTPSLFNTTGRVSFSHLVEVRPGSTTESTVTSVYNTPGGAKSSSSLISNKSNRIRPSRKIFFVCFHLPVMITKDPITSTWSACWSESLIAATEESTIRQSHECHWIGTVSCSNYPILSVEDRDSIRMVLKGMNCTPLFLEEDVQDAHYLGMCKQVLWPAFHNIDLIDLKSSGWDPQSAQQRSNKYSKNKNNINYKNDTFQRSSSLEQKTTFSDWDQSRLDSWWDAYFRVNEAFAEILSTMVKPGDLTWIHDYHLSLLPKMLDDREHATYDGMSVTKKVFYLHIPFPTSQIFRELECGEALLEGMLHADVVGFHSFDHARHFLNATKRILGLNYDSLVGGLIGVQFNKRTVLVTMHNVSIEPKLLSAAIELPSVGEGTSILRHKYATRMIIAGIDTAQRLSGISLKLLAFERLLTDYPVWKQKIALVQKCLIPSSRLLDEANTLKEIRHLVKRIQDKFGPHVIDCEEIIGSSLPIDQRIALWNVADVLMITPIREGLNLLPLEYVYVRKEPAPPGVVISSEFSAVCSVLNGALRCNPFDIQMTVTIIDKALTMKAEEKQGRRIRDAGFVSSSPSGLWARKILRDLTDATIATSNNSTMDDADSDDTSIMGTKFDKKDLITCTAAFLEYEKDLAFCHLDMNSVIHSYNKSNKRVIILDLNGTIVMKEPPGKYLKREILGTSGQKPPVQVCDALTKLCEDPRNIIYVVSGDSQENVLQSIGQIPGLGLAASNGACFAPPRKQGETQYNWKYFDLGVEWEAVKKIVLPVLSKYTARSNGSFVKLTHSSIGWSYYSCDPEWGSLQASHLVMELEPALRPFDVRFAMIKGIVEIVPRQLNKGLIVRKVLQEVSTHDVVDFILCMGDDIHDEKMFTSVSSFIADQDDADHATKAPPVVDLAGNPLLDDSSTISNINSMMKGVTNASKDNVDVHAFTVAVGKKPSHAFAYVDDSSDVASLLLRLAGLDEDSQPSIHNRSFDYNDSGNYF